MNPHLTKAFTESVQAVNAQAQFRAYSWGSQEQFDVFNIEGIQIEMDASEEKVTPLFLPIATLQWFFLPSNTFWSIHQAAKTE